jgi:hypothetical protein
MDNTFDYTKALSLLKEGKRVRRQSWDAEWFVEGQIVHITFANSSDDEEDDLIDIWKASTDELMATDWEEYNE